MKTDKTDNRKAAEKGNTVFNGEHVIPATGVFLLSYEKGWQKHAIWYFTVQKAKTIFIDNVNYH